MPTDTDSGLVEPDIVVNGRALTFAECMAVRVAVSSFRISLQSGTLRKGLGRPLAAGYDHHLANVERAMFTFPPAYLHLLRDGWMQLATPSRGALSTRAVLDRRGVMSTCPRRKGSGNEPEAGFADSSCADCAGTGMVTARPAEGDADEARDFQRLEEQANRVMTLREIFEQGFKAGLANAGLTSVADKAYEGWVWSREKKR